MNMNHIVRCRKNGGILIFYLYINDLIFIRNNPSKFEDFKKAMTKEFEMTKEMLGTCWLLKGMGGKCLKMGVDCK